LLVPRGWVGSSSVVSGRVLDSGVTFEDRFRQIEALARNSERLVGALSVTKVRLCFVNVEQSLGQKTLLKERDLRETAQLKSYS
jgi:hypothetical protein